MKHIALFFFITLGFISSSQLKSSFSLEHINHQVLINITINSGNLCNGIKILRSTDSINFDHIGTIPGYCGNLNETVSYSYNDLDPVKNQKSYYQLELVGLETTKIQSILVIDLTKSHTKIWPHPISDVSRLYFENKGQEDIILKIFSLSGELVQEQFSQNSFIDITASSLNNGIYIYQLYRDNIPEASGKLIISK